MFLRYIGYIFWLVTIELVGLDESGKGERGVGMFEKDYGGVKFDDLEPPPTPGGLTSSGDLRVSVHGVNQTPLVLHHWQITFEHLIAPAQHRYDIMLDVLSLSILCFNYVPALY